MKRLVIAALAIGALAACTKSNVQLEQPGEISFQPVAQKATKAAVDEANYPTTTDYNFNVWAWWGDYDAGTALASFTTTTPYIANGTFVHRTETANSWGGRLHTTGQPKVRLCLRDILLPQHLVLQVMVMDSLMYGLKRNSKLLDMFSRIISQVQST